MANLLTINEKTEEVRRLREEGKSLEEALEIVKGYEDSDQTNPSNQVKTNKEIIALENNISKEEL